MLQRKLNKQEVMYWGGKNLTRWGKCSPPSDWFWSFDTEGIVILTDGVDNIYQCFCQETIPKAKYYDIVEYIGDIQHDLQNFVRNSLPVIDTGLNDEIAEVCDKLTEVYQRLAGEAVKGEKGNK